MEENNCSTFISKAVDFCKGDCPLSDIVDLSKNLIEGKEEHDIESYVADVLWFIDTLLGENLNEKIKDNFVTVIRLCEKSVPLNPAFLKDRLSDDILESLRLITSKQQYNSRYVKTKTRVFYKQNKFNLIREANEGFSKLIVELVVYHNEPVLVVEKIKSLIGYFDLDPNRVIDLILDVLELRLDKSEHFIKLLKLLNADKQDMVDLIGHKFTGTINDSIYELIMNLVKYKAIDLASMYEHLSPSDEEIKKCYDTDRNEAETKRFANTFASKLKEDGSTNTEEVEEVKLDERDYSTNQKLRLCHFFLEAGDWESTRTIMDALPPYFAFRYIPLCRSICRILSNIIEPLYQKYCQLPPILKNRRQPKQYSCNGVFSETVGKFDDLTKLVFEMMSYLGPMLSTDMVLFTKLIRITQAFLYESKTKYRETLIVDEVYQGFYNLLRNCLLPSLSMLSGNISLAEEMWDALKYLPYDIRYSLYISWKDISRDDHPGLIEQKRNVQSQVRYILKRLSKENVKQIGRHIGKLCHCNPGIVFIDVLNTILMFSNLTVPVVDTFKYLGNLSLDVLMFSIIETLAVDRLKMEDSQLSQWMQVMSSFCGLLCKRYQFDLVGLLQFILNKIKDGNCADLIIVKEIIHKMTGIEISEDITEDQIDAMSGGDLLRQEAGYFIQIRNVRKNSSRLKDILLEYNLAVPYVIILSQERNIIIHKSSDNHLKVMGRLYDQCQDTMLQMISFFSLHWSASEMVNNCPSLSELFIDYKVDPDVAFYLNRSNFNFKVQEKFKLAKGALQENNENDELELFANTAQDVIEEFVDAVTPNFSQEIWDDFNSSFYTTFWLLQTSDLIIPDAAYRKQEAYLKSQIRQTELDNSLNSFKKQKEIDRYNGIIDKLKEEQKKGENHVKLVDYWLNSVKGKWFVRNKSGTARAIVMTRFIELCVFPRVCFSSNDAVFVAHLIYKLHRIKTPSFSTLICLDRIFNDITLMISTCSENEAKRYGRFLDSILNIIMRWHSSEDVFNEDCVAHPGFVTVFRKNTDGNNKADQLTYENYRHVLHKWHYRVTKSIVACLESENYVQIRNSLIVLEKILNNYPRVYQFGQAIERRIELLKDKEKDKRPDLHVLTQSYYGHLIAKKSQWLQDKDFHQKDDNRKPVTKPTIPVVNGEKNGVNGSSDINSTPITKKDSSVVKRSSDIEDKDSIDSKRRKIDINQVDSGNKRMLTKEKSKSTVRSVTQNSKEVNVGGNIRQLSKKSSNYKIASNHLKNSLVSRLKSQTTSKRNSLSKSF